MDEQIDRRAVGPVGDVVVQLRFLRDDVPPDQRLKRLLKVALRVYNLRCVAVAEAKTLEQFFRDRLEKAPCQENQPTP